ncbi:hypothetical protein B0H13DRAFT_2355066 [Mycena leptocephala]|nr:hypothetical protein B0H13DRAFT_2355066 [Mycena leptocephala]
MLAYSRASSTRPRVAGIFCASPADTLASSTRPFCDAFGIASESPLLVRSFPFPCTFGFVFPIPTHYGHGGRLVPRFLSFCPYDSARACTCASSSSNTLAYLVPAPNPRWSTVREPAREIPHGTDPIARLQRRILEGVPLPYAPHSATHLKTRTTFTARTRNIPH